MEFSSVGQEGAGSCKRSEFSVRQIMSFAEMKEALTRLSPAERADLSDHLHALDEGVSVEELRRMNAALDEELNDPSPGLTVEEVRSSLRSLKPGDVP